MKIRKFKDTILNELINSKTSASSRRFVTLIVAFHFILASFIILFFAFYVVVYNPRGKIEPTLLSLLSTVLEYDFYIILAGLGFVTVTDFGHMMKEKMKVIASANILTGNPTAEDLTINDNSTKAGNVNTENIETVNTNTVQQKKQQVPDDLKPSNNEQE